MGCCHTKQEATRKGSPPPQSSRKYSPPSVQAPEEGAASPGPGAIAAEGSGRSDVSISTVPVRTRMLSQYSERPSFRRGDASQPSQDTEQRQDPRIFTPGDVSLMAPPPPDGASNLGERSMSAGASRSDSRSGASGSTRGWSPLWKPASRRNSIIPLQVQMLGQRLTRVEQEHAGNPLHPETLGALWDLGYGMHIHGMSPEAIPYAQQALDGFRRAFGADNPNTIAAKVNLASMLQSSGRRTEAEPLLREAHKELCAVSGEDDPATLNTLYNLSLLLHDDGRSSEAEPVALAALYGHIAHEAFGPGHPRTLACTAALASILCDLGRTAESVPLATLASEGYKRRFGHGHPETLPIVHLLRELAAGSDAADRDTVMVMKRKNEGLGLQVDSLLTVTGVIESSCADLAGLGRFRNYRVVSACDTAVSTREELAAVLKGTVMPVLRLQRGSFALASTSAAAALPPRHPGAGSSAFEDPEKPILKVGDEVRVKRDRHFVAEQCDAIPHLGWNSRMKPYCGATGIVKTVEETEVELLFNDGAQWWWPSHVVHRPRRRSGWHQRRRSSATSERPHPSPESSPAASSRSGAHSSPDGSPSQATFRPRLLPRTECAGASDALQTAQDALGVARTIPATGNQMLNSKLQALEEAMGHGLFTEEEYERKKCEILQANSCAGGGRAASPDVHTPATAEPATGGKVRLVRDVAVEGRVAAAGTEAVSVQSPEGRTLSSDEVTIRLTTGALVAVRPDDIVTVGNESV